MFDTGCDRQRASAPSSTRWIAWMPLLFVAAFLYWSVALGLGGLSLMAASAISSGAESAPVPSIALAHEGWEPDTSIADRGSQDRSMRPASDPRGVVFAPHRALLRLIQLSLPNLKVVDRRDCVLFCGHLRTFAR